MKKSNNLNTRELKMLNANVKKNNPRKQLLILFPFVSVNKRIENTNS